MVAKIQKYFSFEEKATRLEFWIGTVFIPSVGLLLLAFFEYLLSNSGIIVGFTVKFVLGFILVALFILGWWLVLATAVRCCHDLCISPDYLLFFLFWRLKYLKPLIISGGVKYVISIFLIPVLFNVAFLILAFAKVDASKLSDNTELEQRKRVLRWQLNALYPFVFFWVVVFWIGH